MAKRSPRNTSASSPAAAKSTPVPSSTRQPIPGAQVQGPVADDDVIDVTIRLREGQKARADRVYRESSRGADRETALTREELAERVGARPEDARLVETYAHEHGRISNSICAACPTSRRTPTRRPAIGYASTVRA